MTLGFWLMLKLIAFQNTGKGQLLTHYTLVLHIAIENTNTNTYANTIAIALSLLHIPKRYIYIKHKCIRTFVLQKYVTVIAVMLPKLWWSVGWRPISNSKFATNSYICTLGRQVIFAGFIIYFCDFQIEPIIVNIFLLSWFKFKIRIWNPDCRSDNHTCLTLHTL